MRSTPLSIAAALATLLLGSQALATPQVAVFSTSGTVVGGDHPTYVVNSTVTFEWDDACNGTKNSLCTLTITMSADPTASGSVPSQGEALSGVLFDVIGNASFRDGPPGSSPYAGATVGASDLIGSGALTAEGELGTLGSLIDVSGHWGLNPTVSVPGEGTVFLGSVGDIFNGVDTLGSMHLFSGTISSVEPNPPNGSNFAIVDSGSSVGGMGFPSGDLAYVQDEIVATVFYTKKLQGIDNVDPVYGTMGQPVPEPLTSVLMGLGLLGLAIAGRRRL